MDDVFLHIPPPALVDTQEGGGQVRSTLTVLPMPSKRIVPASNLTPAQSHYVLGRLLRDGRVGQADVRRALDAMQNEIRNIEAQLAGLRAATGGTTSVRASQPVPVPIESGTPKPTRKRRRASRPASPEVRAARKLQGQYLGYMRQVPKTKRNHFKKLFAQKGRAAAVAAMKKLLGK